MLLFIADIHIKLGQKNVPIAWQKNRFMMLAWKINSIKGVENVIIAGDLLDVADPSIQEVGLMYDFLKEIKAPKTLIPGNHELIDKKHDCYEYVQSMLADLNVKVIRKFENYLGLDFVPYNILKDQNWPEPKSNICVTHVRGEIPPHVKPEIDLTRFSKYNVVIAGDLHSTKNSQGNIMYPGSPMVTSFHRNRVVGSNGLFLLKEGGKLEWLELDLPQLIRTTVSDPSLMVPTEYDHTIYELEGSIEDLKKVTNKELLDKKVVKGISTPATLNMSGDIQEEVEQYISVVLGLAPGDYLTLLEDIS